MKPSRCWLCVAGFTMPLLTACATAPEHLYTLRSADESAAPSNVAPTIIVGPLSIPELVDRPQLVMREGRVRVIVSEQERWASPLKEALSRLITSQLGVRMTNWRFVPAFSAAHAQPTGYLSIDITRLDLERGSGTTLNAHWVYRTADASKALEGDSTAQSHTQEPGYAELVATLSQAGTMLADEIAEQFSQDHP